MPEQRQPIDLELEAVSQNRTDDSVKREASPLELEDEDLEYFEDVSEDDDDMDY